MKTREEIYDLLNKLINTDSHKLALSDPFSFQHTNKRLTRKSAVGWEFIQIFLKEIEKEDVTHCIYFGSLVGLVRCGHEQPHMDDWDIIVPNDKANIEKLDKAIANIKKIFGKSFVHGTPHRENAFGRFMHICLPVKDRSTDDEDKYLAYKLAQLDVFFVDISDGIIHWPTGKRNGPSAAIGEATNTWPVARNEGESSSLIFPSIKSKIKNYNVYLPPIAYTEDFLSFMNRGYHPSPVEHIHITTHFSRSVHVKLQNQEYTPYLEAFYMLEDKAMYNINQKAKESKCKLWEDMYNLCTIKKMPEYDSAHVFPISSKNYFKLLPHVLSIIDNITVDYKCSIPAKLIFLTGDIILYRPNIIYNITEKCRKCDKPFIELICKSNNNMLTTRKELLDQSLPIKDLNQNALQIAENKLKNKPT